MEFYLIRHGLAEQLENHINDLDRKLTKEGKKRVKNVAKFISKFFPSPDLLLTSEALRSIETAEIFKKKCKIKKLDSYSRLNPGASVQDYNFILGAYLNKELVQSNYRVGIITHEPDLSNFAVALLANQILFDFDKDEIIYNEIDVNLDLNLKKSSVLIIEWNGIKSELKFYSIPSLIKKIIK